MAKKRPDEEAFIRFGELQIPVSLYFEQRRNTRISIGSETIHLRLPHKMSNEEYRDQITWAKKWLHRRFEKAPALLERFKSIYFKNGDRIKVMRDVYVLHIDEAPGKSVKAELEGNDIFMTLCADMPIAERNKSIQSILHKLMCHRYLEDVSDRVRELNQRFYREAYRDVSLKYIHSKWGSCSSDGNIVLSSKLLLCPKWVRDYVIVHELAHLRELNHSPKFWRLVEAAYPDYKKADKWLDEVGTGLEIRPVSQSATSSDLDDIAFTGDDLLAQSQEQDAGETESTAPSTLDSSTTTKQPVPIPASKHEDEPTAFGEQLSLF